MANYRLVHGGCRGGWVWKRVARPLREEGHDVYTPTMTRLGERWRLLNAALNLSTNIQDIVNVIKFEELNDVILSGYSYAGLILLRDSHQHLLQRDQGSFDAVHHRSS